MALVVYEWLTLALWAPAQCHSFVSVCHPDSSEHLPDHSQLGPSLAAGCHIACWEMHHTKRKQIHFCLPSSTCHTNLTCLPPAAAAKPRWARSSPYALPLRHYLVPLLEGPVAATLGHLSLLQGLLQLLGDGLALLPQHVDLLVGSLHVQGGRILFLEGDGGELTDLQMMGKGPHGSEFPEMWWKISFSKSDLIL